MTRTGAQREPVPVTQPTVPPMQDFLPYLDEIWRTRHLTNAGPLHQRLEAALAEHLDVEHVSLFNNGTVALMAAVKALALTGEVVTTPFSFVATAHSLVWSGVKPVFADIDPRTCNLDPAQAAAAVTARTSGIMPVHCYGTPCDVDGIAKVAGESGLKVVYDAAHAFGIRRKGSSLLRHGDLSVLSFHATKVFNTVEGGAIVSHDAAMKRRIDSLRNFGFAGETSVTDIGLNGKLSEVHAAFGLAQLPHLGSALAGRAAVARRYRQELAEVPGLHLLAPPADATENFSYFPVLVGREFPLTRDALHARLKEQGILSRRYFYPLIPDMEAYAAHGAKADVPVARRVSEQVLCLPIFGHMSSQQQDAVLAAVRQAATR